MAARKRLRSTLGLPPETSSAATVVGMISDEIETMRAAGHCDIANLVRDAAGQNLGADAIVRFYAPSDERRRPD